MLKLKIYLFKKFKLKIKIYLFKKFKLKIKIFFLLKIEHNQNHSLLFNKVFVSNFLRFLLNP